MGHGTLWDVRDGSENPRGGQGTGSGDHLWFPRRVRGTSLRSGMGRGTLGEDRGWSSTLGKVRYGSGNPQGGRERFEYRPWRL